MLNDNYFHCFTVAVTQDYKVNGLTETTETKELNKSHIKSDICAILKISFHGIFVVSIRRRFTRIVSLHLRTEQYHMDQKRSYGPLTS